jgi:hypothetical protein
MAPSNFKSKYRIDHDDPVLDDLDEDLNAIYETEEEARLEWLQGWILPVFGVLGALLGPWLLIGLLFVLLKLFAWMGAG